MKLKNTLAAVESRFEERRKHFLDQFFQDEEAVKKAVNEELWDGCTVDFIRNCMMSFIHKFYPLEDTVGYEHHIKTDMMRREGGEIIDYLYRAVRSEAVIRAFERAEKEFSGIKEKRQRFEDTLERIRKSKSENHQAKLAAAYAFEEERVQYQDDVAFSNCVTDDDFKDHIDLLSNRLWRSFNVQNAVEKARDLMKSSRMKGRNFRKPIVDADAEPDF